MKQKPNFQIDEQYGEAEWFDLQEVANDDDFPGIF